MKRYLRGLLMVLSVAAVPACGAAGSSQPANATQSANQRLEGDWRLLSFQPNLALEEPLRGLVNAQLSTLTISFANGEFVAQGPSVNTGGRFEVKSAEGDSLSGRLYDRAGAGYNVSGTFVGSQFQFISEDPPWAGRGVLERAR